MDDPAPVGGVERVGDLDGDVERLVERHRAPLEPSLERLSLEALHHEEVDLPLAPHVVDGADVRVAEAGEGPRLAAEAGQEVGVGPQLRGQHLDRDRALEARVAGLVDLAHPARAQRPRRSRTARVAFRVRGSWGQRRRPRAREARKKDGSTRTGAGVRPACMSFGVRSRRTRAFTISRSVTSASCSGTQQ